MSGGRSRAGPAGKGRLARALCAIALAAVAATAAGGAGRLASSGVLREASSSALWETAVGEAAAGPALPEGFEEEVLSVAGRAEVRSDGRAPLVGFTAKEGAPSAFEAVAEELAAKGWRRVGGGAPTCGTFSKEDGRHRWLFVSCVQVGEKASVVVQCAASADERG